MSAVVELDQMRMLLCTMRYYRYVLPVGIEVEWGSQETSVADDAMGSGG
jgi:hypothetical protein